MKVEVLAVGTELLLGQHVNTNASEIGMRLAGAGLDHLHQQVVGDNEERIAAAIRLALDRSDALIITGGIGPTQDDLTREAICAATGRTLVFDAAYADRLRSYWERRGRVMPEQNLRQATHPEGATLIPNHKGTAPGLRLELDGRWIFALPGVPAEMLAMLERDVIPMLAGSGDGVIASRLLRTWGETESGVASRLGDLFAASANPTVAFLASSGEIKVRLTAKAATEDAALDLIAPVEQEVRERLGPLVFGADAETIERVLLAACAERGWSLGTAESATGGLVAARITSVPGASDVFRGSIVAYATEVKRRVLEVEPEVLATGVVSEDTARAMADGAAAVLGADVVVAVTGSAGPDPQERAVGTMVVAVRTPEDTRARTLRMPGDRERIRAYTATAALQLARRAVLGVWWGPE